MTQRYLNCPSGQLIRMLCVITMRTIEGVKTWLVFKGQASPYYRISTVLFARIMDMSPYKLWWNPRLVKNIYQSLFVHHLVAGNHLNVSLSGKILQQFKTSHLSFSTFGNSKLFGKTSPFHVKIFPGSIFVPFFFFFFLMLEFGGIFY